MSDGRLSPSTKALLAAARADGPSHGARTKMWARVSSAAGGAAGVAAGGSAAAATGAGAAGVANGSGGAGGASAGSMMAGGAGTAMKALTIGTLHGGTVTVGMAAVLLHVGAARAPDARAKTVVPVAAVAAAGATPRAPAAADRDPRAQAPLPGANTMPPPADVPAAAQLALGTTQDSPVAPAPLAQASVASATPAPSAQPGHAVHTRASRRIEDSNSLSMEASLITQARTALENGDALSALRKARAARSLPVRQLVPEELSVEAQALRALGRDAEANNVDQILRAQYPESALAR
jgi:hypothetical protein